VKFAFVLFIAAFIAMICSSCSERGARYIKEGEIHYSIEYIGTFGALPKEVFPKNLIVSFKHNKILFEMISPIGNSGILNLSNPEKNIYDTYFSLFTLKYYYPAKKGEMYPGFEAMDGMELRKTEKTSVICGYNCKNAEITFPSDRQKVYDVWYTNEIHVKDPNVCSPFYSIDGVLMSFIFRIGHSELHFNAENIYRKDIPDQIFERREKFKPATRPEIIKFLTKMLNL
jgi:GLPGLI family protein